MCRGVSRENIETYAPCFLHPARTHIEVVSYICDHAAVICEYRMEGKKRKLKERKCVSKKKNLDSSLYNEFADMMCDRVHKSG